MTNGFHHDKPAKGQETAETSKDKPQVSGKAPSEAKRSEKAPKDDGGER